MILEYLQTEKIKAMKNGEKIRKEVLSSIISAIKKASIDKKQKDNITDELANDVLIKEQKTIQEMVDTCPSNRTDLLEEYNTKLSIIKEYAPQLITDEETIKHIIYVTCSENEIIIASENKREIMKTIMPILKGKVDMKIANKIINEILKQGI